MATSKLCFYSVVVLAHVVFLTQGQTVTCRYADSILANGTCFRYNATGSSWAAAKAYCESWNGALAKVNSSAQINAALKNAAPLSNTWIGANDIDVEGIFIWDHDKSPVGSSLTGIWGVGEPMSYNPLWDCAVFVNPGSYLLTEDCTLSFGSLCMEMPLPTTTSPTTTTTTSTTTATPLTTTSTPTTTKPTTTIPITTTSTPTTTTTTPTTTTSTPTIATATSTTATTTSTSTSIITTETPAATTNATQSTSTTSESTNTTREETTPLTTTVEKAFMRGGAEAVKATITFYILPALVALVFERHGRLYLQ